LPPGESEPSWSKSADLLQDAITNISPILEPNGSRGCLGRTPFRLVEPRPLGIIVGRFVEAIDEISCEPGSFFTGETKRLLPEILRGGIGVR